MASLNGQHECYDDVIEVVGKYRDDLLARIRDVNNVTEREVLSAGKSIEVIVDKAASHIRELKVFLQGVTGESGKNNKGKYQEPNPTDEKKGISEAIRQQVDVIENFVESITAAISQQNDLAKRAAEQAQKIAEAASAVATLSMASNVLSINARIEAARLGVHGQGFSVITAEMKRLSTSIATTNEMINSLARSLGDLLPAIERGTMELQTRTANFGDELSQHVSCVEKETTSLQDNVKKVLVTSDRTMALILGSSQDALSHLQFQDLVAQALLRMDERSRTMQGDVADILGMREGEKKIRAAAHVEIGGDKPVEVDHAGEVLLF